MSDPGVTPARFRALIARLGPWLPDTPDAPPVALAVSGGGDSLALAWLASCWRKRLIAFVVDHGLRPGAAAEAAHALDMLQKLGVEGRLIRLKDLRPGPALAQRARTARYDALFAACRAAGCLDLLVAHQADDQAETVAMRQRRGPGDGLSGMAWVTGARDVRVVRPLLGVSRQALRATLERAGLRWCDDPSNENLRAERVRVRQALGDAERHDLLALAGQVAHRRIQRESAVARELAETATFSAMGWVSLGETLPSVEALAALIRCVGGADYPPAASAVAALCRAAHPATLGGVRLLLISGRRGGLEWVLVREAAAMEAHLPAVPGGIWDGRFRLETSGDVRSFQMGATGYGLKRSERAGLPAMLTATLPALWRDGRRVCVPHLGLCGDEALRGAQFHLVPPAPVTVCARRILPSGEGKPSGFPLAWTDI